MTAIAVPDIAPAQSAKSALSPSEHPIVFYDGVCGLCNHSVKLLITLDRNGIFQYAPLQGETARQFLNLQQDLSKTPSNGAESEGGSALRSVVLLDDRGEHRYSTAVVRILWHLGGFWRVLGGLLWIIPRPLRNWGYTIVAHYRYRWFGKTDACRLPLPEERERLLP